MADIMGYGRRYAWAAAVKDVLMGSLMMRRVYYLPSNLMCLLCLEAEKLSAIEICYFVFVWRVPNHNE